MRESGLSKKAKLERQTEVIARLLNILKPGDEVHTTVKHVARSGMSRSIDLFHFYVHQGQVEKVWLSSLVVDALDWPWDSKREAIRVGGAGMNMCFHTVYSLGRVLWPNGFACAGILSCRSNDHSNPGPNRSNYAATIIHHDGGYALRQRDL